MLHDDVRMDSALRRVRRRPRLLLLLRRQILHPRIAKNLSFRRRKAVQVVTSDDSASARLLRAGRAAAGHGDLVSLDGADLLSWSSEARELAAFVTHCSTQGPNVALPSFASPCWTGDRP